MTVVNGRTLDRVYLPDPRSDAYTIDLALAWAGGPRPSKYDLLLEARIVKLETAVFGPQPAPQPPPPTPAAVSWVNPYHELDQGQTGMCVGYGFTNWCQTAPESEQVIEGDGGAEGSTPDTIYDLAQRFDGQPSDDQAGASVLGGAKAVASLGRCSSYHWAKTSADVIAALSVGPVVFGTDWLDGMFTPDADGVIHATGAVQGGHCYECVGYDPSSDRFEIANSWGPSWGVNGHAFISRADVDSLLAADGECCLPLK